ncbi:MAG: alpha/beta hydrolase [Patescibacteria group bacterium]
MQDSVVINQQLIVYNILKNQVSEKVLIFLHGWKSQGLVWKNVAEKISNQGFAVYMLDLPGFGNSPQPKSSFSVQDYADVVREFIKKLKLNNVVLVGHSFGGRIAINLASSEPALIKKVVLVAAAGLRTKKGSDKIVFLAKLAKPFFKPKFMAGLRKKIYKALGSVDYIESGNLKETYLKVASEDLSGYLSKISQSTLIIWGEDDKDTPLAFAKIMNEKIKNSKLVVLKEAGHFSFLDKPQEFMEELTKFIR